MKFEHIANTLCCDSSFHVLPSECILHSRLFDASGLTAMVEGASRGASLAGAHADDLGLLMSAVAPAAARASLTLLQGNACTRAGSYDAASCQK